MLAEIPPRIWTNLLKIMDDFDNANLWNFDIFKYQDILGDCSLHHFGIRLFQKYGLIDKF